jgi:hypothetical protein
LLAQSTKEKKRNGAGGGVRLRRTLPHKKFLIYLLTNQEKKIIINVSNEREVFIMIKYPVEKETIIKLFPVIETNSIKACINAGFVEMGTKFRILGRDVTCVHISGDEYIFAFDDNVASTTYQCLPCVLKKVFNDTTIFPTCLKSEIEYLFIPTEFQVFGTGLYEKNIHGLEWFDYYKDNPAHRIKTSDGLIEPYWLSTPRTDLKNYYCLVKSNGEMGSYNINSAAYGVAIHFVIKK